MTPDRSAGRTPRVKKAKNAKQQPRTAGQRAGVSRDDVLAAAHGIAAREGLEQVTMRRLAAELGVAPNALYTYFANKTALLDAMVDAALAGVEIPEVDVGPWKDNLASLMRASRRALLAHPHLVSLVIARPAARARCGSARRHCACSREGAPVMHARPRHCARCWRTCSASSPSRYRARPIPKRRSGRHAPHAPSPRCRPRSTRRRATSPSI